MSDAHEKAVCFALAEYEHALSSPDADFRVVALLGANPLVKVVSLQQVSDAITSEMEMTS